MPESGSICLGGPTPKAKPEYNSGAMTSEFDLITDRRNSDSLKWRRYGQDVLPLWVADMDFKAPEAVIRRLHQRVSHGVFGYGVEMEELREAVCARMEALYRWRVSPEAIVFLPGLVSGLNVAVRAAGQPGDAILVNTPVYPPFLSAPPNQQRELISVEQTPVRQDGYLRYAMDPEALEAAVSPSVRMFILCNPHNPTGRVYSRSDLELLADFCLRHELLICSDEIHCDLLLGETRHLPFSSLNPEIEARTITLLAPSKTFNIPGLGCSMGIVPNESLRRRFNQAARGIVPEVNILGMDAAVAAYADSADWLLELLHYLERNRDFVGEFVRDRMPGMSCTLPEATYLAWLDCRALGDLNPHRFFLEKAGVALNDGGTFGPGGKGFVRLNFGCPRAILEEALVRMSRAWNQGT